MNPETRRQLARLARQKKRRQIPADLPCDWCPWRVKQPNTEDLPFSPDAAWEFIADLLEDIAGQAVEEITLENPAGRTAYVMKYSFPEGTVYIKVHFDKGRQNIQGRSFHYSDQGTKQ